MEFFALISAFLFMPYAFFAICIALFFLVALGIENAERDGDGWGWATIGSAGLIFMIAKYLGITIADIKAAPMFLVYGTCAYLIVGVLWSFAKWYFKLSNIREAYIELKSKFIDERKLKQDFLKAPHPIAACETKEDQQERDDQIELNRHFFNVVRNSMLRSYATTDAASVGIDPSYITEYIKPVATKHKSTITQWIAFWPISFTWTIINDPVRKIANYIFTKIKGTFQRMSDAMFAGV
jgi:hypothetical protein